MVRGGRTRGWLRREEVIDSLGLGRVREEEMRTKAWTRRYEFIAVSVKVSLFLSHSACLLSFFSSFSRAKLCTMKLWKVKYRVSRNYSKDANKTVDARKIIVIKNLTDISDMQDWNKQSLNLEKVYDIIHMKSSTKSHVAQKSELKTWNRRAKNAPQFREPSSPLIPLSLYECRGRDGTIGLRLCKSWVKRDRNYIRAADGDKAAIQELHFLKLQQPLYNPLFLSPSLLLARRRSRFAGTIAGKRARLYTRPRRGRMMVRRGWEKGESRGWALAVFVFRHRSHATAPSRAFVYPRWNVTRALLSHLPLNTQR